MPKCILLKTAGKQWLKVEPKSIMKLMVEFLTSSVEPHFTKSLIEQGWLNRTVRQINVDKIQGSKGIKQWPMI